MVELAGSLVGGLNYGWLVVDLLGVLVGLMTCGRSSEWVYLQVVCWLG